MNTDKPTDYHYTDAHCEALKFLSESDKAQGHLPCHEYFAFYHNLLGENPPAPSSDLLYFLDTSPTIGSCTVERQALAEVYSRIGLEMPAGLHDLPIWWATAIRRAIANTNWVEFDQSRIKDVFGWASVFHFGGYLDIHYINPLPPKQTLWWETGSILLDLHQSLEPGPYTSKGRLTEFL
jgi:hypothetical protein